MGVLFASLNQANQDTPFQDLSLSAMSNVINRLEPLGIENPSGVKHSIIEVILQVNFANSLSEVENWRNKLEVSTDLLDIFENSQDLVNYGFAIQANSEFNLTTEDAKPIVIGFRAEKKIKDRHEVEWVALVQNTKETNDYKSKAEFHCLHYSQFFDLDRDLKTWLQQISQAWPEQQIQSYSLAYVDRFGYPAARIESLQPILSAETHNWWLRMIGESHFGHLNQRSFIDTQFEEYQLMYQPDGYLNSCMIQFYHAFANRFENTTLLSELFSDSKFSDLLLQAREQNRKRMKEIFSVTLLNKIGIKEVS